MNGIIGKAFNFIYSSIYRSRSVATNSTEGFVLAIVLKVSIHENRADFLSSFWFSDFSILSACITSLSLSKYPSGIRAFMLLSGNISGAVVSIIKYYKNAFFVFLASKVNLCKNVMYIKKESTSPRSFFIAEPHTNVAHILASALLIEGVSRNRNALIDGNTENYDWESGYTCHQIGSGCITVQLAQPYIIGSMRCT